MAISYTATAWNSVGTFGNYSMTKDVTVTAAAGDLLVAMGTSENVTGNSGDANAISTYSGSTGTWTIGRTSAVQNNTSFIMGHATVSTGGSITVRVTVGAGGSGDYMGAAVWLVPADEWSGTPTYTSFGTGSADGLAVDVVVSSTSSVLYGGSDWSSLNPGTTSTPAGAVTDSTFYDDVNYTVFTRHWVDQAAGTRSYGPNAETGNTWVGAAVVIEEPPPVTYVAAATVGLASSTSTVFTKPGGVSTGDVALFHVAFWSSGQDLTGTPSGSVEVVDYQEVADRFGGYIRSFVYAQRVGAETSYTFTTQDALWRSGTALFFTGVDPDDDLTALPSAVTSNDTASTTIPGVGPITVPLASGIAYFVNGEDDDTPWTTTPPTGFTERHEEGFAYAASMDDAASTSISASAITSTRSNNYISAVVGLPPAGAPSGTTEVTATKTSAWNVESNLVPIPVSLVAAGSAPATGVSATSFPLAYPAGLNEGDLLLAFIVEKLVNAPAPTATDWRLVATSSKSDPAQGVGTAGRGEQTMFVMARTVPAGGLSGSATFTCTGVNNTNGRMLAYRYNATGASSAQWEVNFSSTSQVHGIGSTAWGVTGTANINLAANDYLQAVLWETDDTARGATPNLTLSCTGVTLGTLVDTGHNLVTTGVDSALSVFGAPVNSGTSSAAPAATLTGAVAEYGGGLFIRVRAWGLYTTPVSNTVNSAWKINAQVSQTVASAWNIASSLTPVTQTQTSAWHVKSIIQQTAQSSWDVTQSVTASKSSAWNIRTIVEQTAQSSWRVTSTIIASAQSAWRVQQQILATQTSAWDVLTIVEQTKPVAWHVLLAVSRSVDSAWKINQQITQTINSAWNVQSPLTSVSQSVASAWKVNAQVSQTTNSAWRVLESVSTTKSSSWSIVGRVTATQDSAYRVLVLVQQTSQSAWHVKAITSQSVSSAWDVLTTVTPQTAPSAWRVLQSVQQTANSAYKINQLVTATASSAWNVAGSLATVTQTASSAWRVLQTVQSTKDGSWRVLEPLTASKTAAWRVLQSVESTKSSAWSIIGTITATKDASWRVLNNVLKTADSAYKVNALVTQSVQSAWDVLDSVTQSQTSAWKINLLVTQTRTSAWNIVGQVTATIDSAWNIDGTTLAIPSGLTAVAVSRTQINLSWNAVNGATGYDIERDAVVIVNSHPTTTYPDTGLGIGTTHSYRVRAVKEV